MKNFKILGVTLSLFFILTDLFGYCVYAQSFEEDEDNDLAIIEEDDDYNTDDVNIENLLKSALYSILTVILFVINLRIIKINDIKTLIINNGISILCSFVAILMIWNNYNFDVNITIIWLIYPLYLCGDYFIKIHGKYLIYEEKVNTEIEKNDIIDEAVC